MKKETLAKICNTFLWFGPLLDILTAFMITKFQSSFTIGVIIRFLYLFFLVVVLLLLKEEKKEKKKTMLVLTAFSLYFITYLVMAYQKEGSIFLLEAKELLRSFYFPLMLFSLSRIVRAKQIALKITIFPKIYFVYLLAIFIPNLLGIGFDSYAVTKTGSVGFFYSANEMSAILSILMPFFLIYIYKKENMLLTAVSFFLLIYVLLSIGTKGPILSLGILIFLFGFALAKKWIRDKKWKILSISLSGIVIFATLLFFLFPKTSFYKNIEVHLDFLEVDSVVDVFKEPRLIDHFIFSSRLSFWEESSKLYQKASLSEKLIGLGYTKDNEEVKMIEMDPLDIFYRHGIIGFLLYFSIVVYVLYNIFRKYAKKKKTESTMVYGSSLFLIILLTFFTGHILLAPAVSIYVCYLLIHLYLKEEDDYETSICHTEL